jgi:HEAT repeat protein
MGFGTLRCAGRAFAGSRAAGLRLPLLALAALGALACSCASSGDPAQGPVDSPGEELTAGQEFLNVVTFPFRMLGYAVYYPLKFLFYDIWAALFDWIFPGGDSGLEAALEGLRSPEPARRADAANALGFYEDPEAAEALVGALSDPDGSVRAAAADALGRLGRAETVGPLAEALARGKTEAERAAAARALGLLGKESALWALMKALDDPSWAVRGEAAMAAGRIGSWKAGARLVSALRDADPRVRGAASLGLAYLGDPRAIPPLRALFARIADEGTYVRASAITALAELGDAGSREAIAAIAEGRGPVDDPHSRAAALWAIGRLGMRERARFRRTLLAAGEEPLPVLEGAALGLALLGEDGRAAAAASDRVMVRLAAAKGLLERGGEASERALLAQAADPYVDVRQRAIVALLILGRRDAVPLLIDQLRSPDMEIRAWAWLELKRISILDRGLEPEDWLAWWKDEGSSWDLRRYYPELPKSPARRARSQ